MTKKNQQDAQPSRRDFLATSSAAIAGTTAAASLVFPAGVHAAADDTIKIALIGSGGRGKGAVSQIFNTKGNTKLVAVADAYQDKAESAIATLTKQAKDKVDVPKERIFTGLDGYKKAIESDCDLVVIATPPGFKPQQFEYAINQNKHVFMEKPVASDAPGVRRVLASVEESKKKNRMVAIGLQRRHEPRYMETVAKIQEGAIGDVICSRVYWNGGGIWYRDKYANENEMKFQVDNWYHFIWACGDQICEQHIHNLDVGCWVKGAYPVECNGMGGHEQRMGGDGKKSQIFDHTFCEYTFADGSKMYSQGRHLKGGWNQVSEFVHGTKGTADPSGRINAEGKEWKFSGKRVSGHQQEQHDLIEALMRGEIYNEGEYGAHSTFTAILGREACYSGKVLKWDELLQKGRDYCPGIDEYTFDTEAPAKKNDNGVYDIPVPGSYNPFA